MDDFLTRQESAQDPLIECLAEHAEHLGSLVYATGKKNGLTPEDAEDAVQDAFLAATETIRHGKADGIRNWQGWFVRTGRNKCVDASRTAKKHSCSRIHTKRASDMRIGSSFHDKSAGKKHSHRGNGGGEQFIDPSWRDESPVERAESVALVRGAICSLRGIDRRLVVYCNLWGHTRAEASAHFGLTIDAIHGKLHRALQALRQKLEPYYSVE